MNPVIAIVGPTAAGKSDLAVEVALRLAAAGIAAEIVNADSMQLYRGMDIGTAKMTPAQRQGITHHLLDVWDVTQAANVAEYQRMARAVIDDLHSRDRLPILVGGSGLYVRGALDHLEFPGTDPAIRARLEDELAQRGSAALHARLATADPQAAEGILPGNGRRIVRALEVIELTGRPFTATMPEHVSLYPGVQIGLGVPRERLDELIERRVDRMWAAGFVDEVRSLERVGLREGRTASRALGYSQVLRFLAGDIDETTARDETVRATRKFARRQQSWFGRDPRVHWLDYDHPELTAHATRLVTDTWHAAASRPSALP
ncbi:tRNA (adenosine(37)-N6)-dimethylallyltransferase MiaA [Salinactinospora qingdaonensis]|uniref:tRNA dimethylallyltransferase n=1 Tax=Salinactinospora qingdaonensis TaxID=702744 RepID=A0ABP7G9U1_9ACTN